MPWICYDSGDRLKFSGKLDNFESLETFLVPFFNFWSQGVTIESNARTVVHPDLYVASCLAAIVSQFFAYFVCIRDILSDEAAACLLMFVKCKERRVKKSLNNFV